MSATPRGFLLLAALSFGCSWIADLTGPSVPDVAGAYAGAYALQAVAGPVTVALAGGMRLDVEQDGNSVTIGGSFAIGDDSVTTHNSVAIDAVSGTITDDGHWTQGAGAPRGFTGITAEDDCRTWDSAVWFWVKRGVLAIELSGRSPEPTMKCPDIAYSASLGRAVLP